EYAGELQDACRLGVPIDEDDDFPELSTALVSVQGGLLRQGRRRRLLAGHSSSSYVYSQLTIRLLPLDVVQDVPRVNTGRDEFRAFFGKLGEHVLTTLVDEGHAGKVNHAPAFPASGFCSRPVGLQFHNPRMNEPAFKRPPLFGECLSNR